MLPTKQDAFDDSQPRSAMRASDQSAVDLRSVRFVERESAKTRQRASSASDDEDGDDTVVIEAHPKRVSASRLERHPRALSRSSSPPPTIERRSASLDAAIGESAASAASGTIATQPPLADGGARRRSSRTIVAATPRRSGRRATRRRLESTQSDFALQLSLRAKRAAFYCRNNFAAHKSLERHAEVCAI